MSLTQLTTPKHTLKDKHMTPTELKAQLEARKLAKAQELSELKETIVLKHELAKLNSPLYDKRELQKSDNTTLDVLLEKVEEVYAKDDRKMSQTFGYGIIPNKILTLLKAIQYTKASDREELLLITGLDEQTIEDTLDAFGNTAYFAKTSIEVVPEIPMDIDRTKELLRLVGTDMSLVSDLDLSKFNIDNVRYQYTRARVKAEEMCENTQQYVQTALSYEE
jgi:hypothetical protein